MRHAILCTSSAMLAFGVALFVGCGSSGPAAPTDDASAPDPDATGSQDDSGGTGSDGSSGGTPDGGDPDSSVGEGGVGDPAGVTASKATSFLSSISVCTHIGQGIDDPAKSAAAMKLAGIRNLRDDGNPAHVQDWIDVYEQSGVRTNLLTNQDVAGTIDMAKKLAAAGALLSVEGPNEPNNFPVTYKGKTSGYATTFAPVANLQHDLYVAVHAEPTLKGIPVFHSSEAGGSEPDNVGLQFLAIPPGAKATMPDGTMYADYANTHNYVCGHQNELVDNVAWNASDPTLNGDWDGVFVEYGHTWHGGFDGYGTNDLIALPRVTTETGWVTTGQGAITEEQQGRLFLNLYLSAFKRGFAYTFVYMLRDDAGQGYWGLFDTSYAPKKSGTYLHNLTTILADPGAGIGTPGKLDYAITTPPATVHDLLLQKTDGSFALVVWNERPLTGSDDVVVSLGKMRPTVTVYDPTTGTTPSQTLHQVSSVKVTLTDHPTVLLL